MGRTYFHILALAIIWMRSKESMLLHPDITLHTPRTNFLWDVCVEVFSLLPDASLSAARALLLFITMPGFLLDWGGRQPARTQQSAHAMRKTQTFRFPLRQTPQKTPTHPDRFSSEQNCAISPEKRIDRRKKKTRVESAFSYWTLERLLPGPMGSLSWCRSEGDNQF